MNRHEHAVFFARGKDRFQKIDEVLEKIFLRNARVQLEQLADSGKSLRLPAGKNRTVRVLLNRFEQAFGVDRIDLRLIIGEHGRAVRTGLGEVAARPVEHGHEIIADHVNAALPEVLNGLNVSVDILIAVGRARL